MTWQLLWIVLGVICWIIGFLRAGYVDKDEGLINTAFVRPPFLVYLICGLPKASNVPTGVIALRSLMAQLQGILFVIYGLTYPFLPTNSLATSIIVLSSVGFIVLWLCWLLFKRYPYKA